MEKKTWKEKKSKTISSPSHLLFRPVFLHSATCSEQSASPCLCTICRIITTICSASSQRPALTSTP
ncbi:hypothetical protein E2C01_012820 [Portunus trituberculatus]|uniref:Uncharacterized protein n=1 Tax=Portunus trituberculatus TaxID=210409 RepID=A0A5B7DFF6_PORTR|nr:hypothetical protein [Portunus trituberculatus]